MLVVNLQGYLSYQSQRYSVYFRGPSIISAALKFLSLKAMKFHHFDDTTFKGTDAQLKRKETEKLNEQSRETLGRRLIFLNPALLG